MAISALDAAKERIANGTAGEADYSRITRANRIASSSVSSSGVVNTPSVAKPVATAAPYSGQTLRYPSSTTTTAVKKPVQLGVPVQRPDPVIVKPEVVVDNTPKQMTPEQITALIMSTMKANQVPTETPEQIAAKYNPEYTQQQFIDRQRQIAEANANLQYDQSGDDLKSRVAKLIAGLNTRLGTLDTKYGASKVDAQQTAYDSKAQIANMLARRGLVGQSGIAQGAEQQNAILEGRMLSDVNTQQNAEATDIQNQVQTNQSDLELALNGLQRDKASYLSKSSAEAEQTYYDRAQQAKQAFIDNYYKSKNLDVAKQSANNQLLGTLTNYETAKMSEAGQNSRFTQQLEQSDKQFLAKMGFDEKSLDANTSLELKKIAQNNAQFLSKSEQDWNMFEGEMGLKRDTLNQSISQFNLTRGDQNAQYAKDLELKYKQLDQQKYADGLNYDVAMAKMKQEAAQFKVAQKSQYNDSGIPYNIIAGVNEKIDGASMALLEQVKAYQSSGGTKGISAEQAKKQITSMVMTSPMNTDKGWTAEKIRMFGEVLTADQRVTDTDKQNFANLSNLMNKEIQRNNTTDDFFKLQTDDGSDDGFFKLGSY